MSLPSQIGRLNPAGSGGRSRTYMISKRRRGKRRSLALMLLTIVGGGIAAYVWVIKPPASGPADAAVVTLDDPPAEQGDPAPLAFNYEEVEHAPRIEPADVELRMGAGIETGDKPADQPAQATTEDPTQPTPDIDLPVQEAARQAPVQNRAPSAIEQADRELANNNPIGARALLNAALLDRATNASQRTQIRTMMADINADLVFSARLYPGEPLTEAYKIKGGDALSTIASRQGLATDWRLIQRVNRISNPSAIRENQTIKLVRGPFHAIVYKSEYRMDIFAGPPEDRTRWLYIRSFPVGLGEDNGTPNGEFVIRPNSKLINPHWVNPRTGERFSADNPDNPIGEHWLGLEGVGNDAALVGYGIHGTTEPASIGQQRSMGCIRMRAEDVALAYELLAEGISRVTIYR